MKSFTPHRELLSIVSLVLLGLTQLSTALATGIWSPAAAMLTARSEHTATLLLSGNVLVAGGRSNGSDLGSAELYDPVTNTWNTVGRLAVARSEHTATLLPSGQVLVAGGMSNGTKVASVEVFDPPSKSWNTVGRLAVTRALHTATLLPSGEVLVVGNRTHEYSLSDTDIAAELYDPVTNASIDANFPLEVRSGHTATLLPSGKVLVAGGGSILWDYARVYDPAANSWNTADYFLSYARSSHTATLLPSGRVLVASGLAPTAPTRTAELFDLTTNHWSTAGSLASSREAHTATLLPSGKVLVTGGIGFGIAGAEQYDPATNAWSNAGSPATPRYRHTDTLLPSGKVLVAGGRSNGTDLASVELYQPTSASFQGLWWNPQESGWGINFAHQGDVIFATWFTYGADGQPQWYTIVANRTAANTYAGPVSSFSGLPFNMAPYTANANIKSPVGAATFIFAADGGSATFTYTVNGITQTKQIVPQQFSPRVAPSTCVWGAQPNLALATNYQDLWWVPDGQEAGWGINFTHQGTTIFATWFTYDANGKAWWLYSVAGETAVAEVYSGQVKTAVGPPFNANPFDPNAVSRTSVGHVTITFVDGNHAIFEYTVNGVTQSKSISRQIFAPPGTVCIPGPTNAPPVANAGPARTFVAGTVVTLDGSDSTDADEDDLTFSWTLTTKPNGSAAALASATSANPTFVADVPGTYVATLIVNDGDTNSSPATVSITVVADNGQSIGTYRTSSATIINGVYASGSQFTCGIINSSSAPVSVTLYQFKVNGVVRAQTASPGGGQLAANDYVGMSTTLNSSVSASSVLTGVYSITLQSTGQNITKSCTW